MFIGHNLHLSLSADDGAVINDTLLNHFGSWFAGTWVQCIRATCMKWRYLSDVQDPSQLIQEWSCEMNPSKHHENDRKYAVLSYGTALALGTELIFR